MVLLWVELETRCCDGVGTLGTKGRGSVRLLVHGSISGAPVLVVLDAGLPVELRVEWAAFCQRVGARLLLPTEKMAVLSPGCAVAVIVWGLGWKKSVKRKVKIN